MEQMNVAEVHYEHWGNETDPNSDWWKLNNTDIVSFSHKDSCEFIVYLGDPKDKESISFVLDSFYKYDMSDQFIETVKTAISLGFKYLCFYS